MSARTKCRITIERVANKLKCHQPQLYYRVPSEDRYRIFIKHTSPKLLSPCLALDCKSAYGNHWVKRRLVNSFPIVRSGMYSGLPADVPIVSMAVVRIDRRIHQLQWRNNRPYIWIRRSRRPIRCSTTSMWVADMLKWIYRWTHSRRVAHNILNDSPISEVQHVSFTAGGH